MRTNVRKKKARETGEDLWAWAERRDVAATTVREEPSLAAQPVWGLGLLKKITGRKD